MPKIAMDYSKVVMYKIMCQDLTITFLYVGSTTNFIKRKALHKCCCDKETHKDYSKKIYQTIRENGGWNNWIMTPIEEFPCENHIQQQIREQYWIEKLKPELNHFKAYANAREEPKKYHQDNKEKRNLQSKKYAETHKEEISERQKIYVETNKKVLNEKKKLYREAHKEEIKEYQKKYRESKLKQDASPLL
jgi:hypothetical protein